MLRRLHLLLEIVDLRELLRELRVGLFFVRRGGINLLLRGGERGGELRRVGARFQPRMQEEPARGERDDDDRVRASGE